IAYMSRAVRPLSDEDLQLLLAQCRRDNAQNQPRRAALARAQAGLFAAAAAAATAHFTQHCRRHAGGPRAAGRVSRPKPARGTVARAALISSVSIPQSAGRQLNGLSLAGSPTAGLSR
nr:hypothetical protein [Tanacetum cinerariifolium]